MSKVTDDAVRAAYARTRSVWTAAVELGVSHSTVQRRLVRLGIPRSKRHGPFSEDERARILQDYAAYRNAGRLRYLASELGRSLVRLSREARLMGLTDKNAPRLYAAVWEHMPDNEAAAIWSEFKASSLGLDRFCALKGYDDLGFRRTMKRLHGDEWDHVLEAKAPRQTKYRIGRAFEYKCRDHLKSLGYVVMRSPRSGSPIDLIAVRPGQVVFLQCKRSGALGVSEWNAVYDLAVSAGAIPVMAEDIARQRPRYWRLVARKDGSRRAQPMEPWLPAGLTDGEERIEVELMEFEPRREGALV